MKQLSLATTEFEPITKRTRKRVFLDEMNQVVSWVELVALIERAAPPSKRGRPPFATGIMLRIHFMQQWFGLSDPALHDVPLYREFAGLEAGITPLPDQTTILRFCHLLESHKLSPKLLVTINTLLADRDLVLKAGTAVNALLIAAPSPTKYASGERDLEMHQTSKGNQLYFGMNAHIGVHAESGLGHTDIGTAADVNDVAQGQALLHGEETDVFADEGYPGTTKRTIMNVWRGYIHFFSCVKP